MMLSGVLLKLGEDMGNGDVISPNCKINVKKYMNEKPVTFNFDKRKEVGLIDSMQYEISDGELLKISVTVDLSEELPEDVVLVPGGIVRERRGNQILDFELREVSIVLNNKTKNDGSASKC